MFESVKLSFFRQVVLIVFCVLLPGFIYGALLFYGQNRSKPNVGNQMSRVVGLQDIEGVTYSVLRNGAGQFEKCVSESGREFCLSLLGEQVSSSFPGQTCSVPHTPECSSSGADDADEGSKDFIAQLRILTAGCMGLAVAFVCMFVGTQLRRVAAA